MAVSLTTAGAAQDTGLALQGLRVRVDVWADEVLADLFGKLCAASATDTDSAMHEPHQFLHIQVQAPAGRAGPRRPRRTGYAPNART